MSSSTKLARQIGRLELKIALPVGFLVGFALLAVTAPWIPAFDAFTHVPDARLQPPSWSHPFGTDELGRSTLFRVILGARVSLGVATGSVALGMVAGALIGVIAGFRGGWIDEAAMRVMDIILAFPTLVFAIAAVGVVGPSLINVTVVLGAVQLPIFARLARSMVLGQLSIDYVAAALSIGSTTPQILRRHIVPNTMAPVLAMAGLMAASAILAEAALSFLGLGVPPPAPTWGNMLALGNDLMFVGAWWLTVFPGLAMFLTMLAFNVLAEAARDRADPTTSKKRTNKSLA